MVHSRLIDDSVSYQEVTWSPLSGYRELGGSSETPAALSWHGLAFGLIASFISHKNRINGVFKGKVAKM